MPSMETIFVILSLTITCLPFVAGEIRHTEIRADGRAAIPLNLFFFTKGGKLELNITRLSLLPVPDPASLSKIGFVLLPPDSWNHLSFNIRKGNTSTCALEYPDAHKVVTFDQFPASAQLIFLHSAPANYCQYTLVFSNCLSQNVKVSMRVRSAMYNRLESGGVKYLVAGPIVPRVYFLFTSIYLVLVLFWVNILLKNRLHISWIHYFMLGTLLLKALNLFCEAMQKWYIDRTGSAAAWWDVGFYASSLLRATSFYTLILIIGYTQWQLLRPQMRLPARDKCILMVLICLQVVANATRVLSDNAGSYGLGDNWWQPLFAFVNSASLWPLALSLWSAMNKLLTARTHRRPSDILKKFEIFRRYLIVVVVYSLFAPILEISLLVLVNSYKYYWIVHVALELVTLAIYAYTGCLFSPKEEDHHQHLLISDEEAAARRLDDEEKDYARLFALV